MTEPLVECACGAMVPANQQGWCQKRPERKPKTGTTPAKMAGDAYCLQPIAGTDVLCSESKPCPTHKET